MDKVARYAQPLLGERAYVATQASTVEISRSRGGATLHESVCVRMDVDPDTDAITWDSYRNPEGRWVVTAFHDGAVIGTWLYEEVGRSVHPQDEAARALMGGGPTAVAERADETAPQVPSVKVEVEPEVEPEVAAETDAEIAAEEAPRPRLVSVTSDPTAERDESAVDRDRSAAPAGLFPETDAGAPDGESAPKRAKRSKGKRGRASVPSWDEILFGATKNED